MARSPAIPRYKRRRSGGSLPRRIVLGVLKLILALLLISILWVGLYRFINPPITATMLGDVFAGRGAKREWLPVDRIDRDMVRAAIAAEDSKFCSHNGFDFDAIEQAMQRNASGGRIRGGSTISQQTAKNAFLWQGGGYFRKGLEAWFAVLMEATWPKQRIMEVYLNLAETGIGTYGVNAGSQRYFRHDASAMSRTEAARIAAVLPLPKKRGATAPKGFTRRYGGTIAARIGAVARDGLDACIYQGIAPPKDKAPPPSRAPRSLPGEEYETARPLPPLEEVVQELPEASTEPLIDEPAPEANGGESVPEAPPGEPQSTEEGPPPVQ
jgi:monofunctional biosynthetic peptidoglycan transglycosylase